MSAENNEQEDKIGEKYQLGEKKEHNLDENAKSEADWSRERTAKAVGSTLTN